MKRVTYHRYWVRAPGRKSEYLTRFQMTAEVAARQYPGSRPEPSTVETRDEPETDAERAAAMFNYPSAGRDKEQP